MQHRCHAYHETKNMHNAHGVTHSNCPTESLVRTALWHLRNHRPSSLCTPPWQPECEMRPRLGRRRLSCVNVVEIDCIDFELDQPDPSMRLLFPCRNLGNFSKSLFAYRRRYAQPKQCHSILQVPFPPLGQLRCRYLSKSSTTGRRERLLSLSSRQEGFLYLLKIGP